MSQHQLLKDAAVAAPPTSVSGMMLFGVPVPELIQLGTLIYLIVMILAKLPDVVEGFNKAWRKYVRKEGDSCTPC